MYDRILLPTDGSEGFRAVARHAGRLAAAHGATVEVLAVADTRNRFESPTAGLSTEAWSEAERERASESIEAAREALPEGVAVETRLVEGVPKAAIMEAIEASEADLVVMGTHGRTGVDHYLVGSVAETVVRQSPVPVLTVQLGD
jgi:nucleotide-binding universal stress UspA family protein